MSDSLAWNWDSPQNNEAANDSPWNDYYDPSNDPGGVLDDFDFDFDGYHDDDSLTLAPINPENNVDNLSHFGDAGLDAPRHPSFSDDPFLSDNPQPPPSNQQARRSNPQRSPSLSAYFREDESPSSFDDLFDETPPPQNMAPSTRSTRNTQSSTSARSTRNPQASSPIDLTASSPPRPGLALSRKRRADTPGEERPSKASKTVLPADSDDVPLVDLVDVNSQKELEEKKARDKAEAIKKANQDEATKPVKLAEFKCIICMDDPTDLTVTHCGHLFCSECLHQALHAGERKCCPVCRNPIVLNRAGQKPTNKGYFPLAMKLMTSKKAGKRPV
ncbi:hypothetical protein BDZ45DRAFT_676657 [Acephala macrosclerotiorum]|nr:hypothetical protein BDZ45DRAFT_676657 [Acephala macrosclerotiorum]